MTQHDTTAVLVAAEAGRVTVLVDQPGQTIVIDLTPDHAARLAALLERFALAARTMLADEAARN